MAKIRSIRGKITENSPHSVVTSGSCEAAAIFSYVTSLLYENSKFHVTYRNQYATTIASVVHAKIQHSLGMEMKKKLNHGNNLAPAMKKGPLFSWKAWPSVE